LRIFWLSKAILNRPQ